MNFGFLLFDDLEELDLVGPWEMITMWSKNAEGPKDCFTIGQSTKEVKCAKGMRIHADYSFENCPNLDYLLIPGGQGTRAEVDNLPLIQFVKTQSEHCQAIASVCTGSFILQAAGLLKEKKATTHWRSLDRLRAFSDVTVVEERFVKDGNVWTAAGVSAGIDMALALIADQAGEEVASKVQLYSEYYPDGKKYGEAHSQPNLPHYINA